MLALISRIPIFRRLFLAFVLATVIPGLVILILSASFINSLTTRSQAEQANIEAIHAATSADSYLYDMNALVIALATHPPTDREELIVTQHMLNGHFYSDARNLEHDFDTSIKQFQQRYLVATANNMSDVNNIISTDDPGGQLIKQQQNAATAAISDLWPSYKQQMDVMLAQAKVGQSASSQQLQTLNARYHPLFQAWTTVSSTTEKISSSVARVGPSQVNPIILGTVIALLGTIMVVVIIGYIVNLTITLPLRQLALLTQRIARGETNARATITGRDEIYMVANSMNNMLDNIVRLIQETQGQRNMLQGQVEKLVSEVSGVGEGDLRIQAEVTADALGVLADSFNYMVEELSSLIVHVQMVAGEVENSTAAILDCMTQLVESGDIQRNQIRQAEREVEYMAGSSRQVAERSQMLYEVGRGARLNAQDGRESLQQAVQGMGRTNNNVQTTAAKVQTLGERSREIDDIVDVISNIAHQTNRLALDAAIQAAMAGENGKGFGAVAADIRRLAERAKEQAGIITHIVRGVREDIGAVAISMQDTERETTVGTKLTQEAGTALESVFAAVEHQAAEIENINKMAMQQVQSSSAIVHIMQAVSESTRQNGLTTRDASQNMERLARLVEQLRASVEAFKLRENQNSPVHISAEEASEDMTFSGIFRTVSAANHSSARTVLPPGPPDGSAPFSFYPMAAHQDSQQWQGDA